MSRFTAIHLWRSSSRNFRPISCFFSPKKDKNPYIHANYEEESFLVFGSETQGLPEWVFEQHSDRIWRIPMFHPKVRSLNLSGAVSIVVYEALRQTGKLTGTPHP